jgi:hypothetical protein
MGKVTSEISMSLDGFITGPNVRVGDGMGDDGDRLHDWMLRQYLKAGLLDEMQIHLIPGDIPARPAAL